MSAPVQKITFAEMRAAGLRGVLVYCSGSRTCLDPIDGRITSGCQILSRGSFAPPAAIAVPTSGRLGNRYARAARQAPGRVLFERRREGPQTAAQETAD